MDNLEQLECEILKAKKKFKSSNKLTKKKTKYFLEAWRRVHEYQNGDFTHSLLLVGTPTQMKEMKEAGFVKPFSGERYREQGWYSLTAKGIAILNSFPLAWNPRYNEILFRM